MKNIYSFEEAVEIMEDKGLGRQMRSDDAKLHYRQFCENGSSLHIHRGGFVLYATTTDYVNIKSAVKEKNVKYLLIEGTKDKAQIKESVKVSKRDSTEAVVLIQNGNRILHNPSESELRHEVDFYTNENFEFITDVLAENPDNLK